MLDGPLVFVDVDTQRDFLDPEGALFVAGSEAIRPVLARLSAFAKEQGVLTIATACAHEPDDREADFPPHCVLGTAGQERIPETADLGTIVVEPGSGAVPPFTPFHVTIHKRVYDVFSTPEAEPIFALYAQSQPTFVVYGVATDFCVKCVVEGLLDRGYQVAVVTDAVRAIAPATEAALLTRLADRGALLTVADVVCAN